MIFGSEQSNSQILQCFLAITQQYQLFIVLDVQQISKQFSKITEPISFKVKSQVSLFSPLQSKFIHDFIPLINLLPQSNKLATQSQRIQNYNTMQKEKRQIRLEDFEIEYKLGEGAYGYVFLASKNCQEYAIKEMSKYQLKKNHCEHLPLIEKEVLRLANHPGIVKSHFAFQTSSKLYLAMQVCEGGSIEDLCHKKMLSEQSKRFYIAELVTVLEYLHHNGIVHRDLKPSNIMLSKNNHIKLIDFGTASIGNSNLISNNFKQKLRAFKSQGHNKQNLKTQEYQKGAIRRKSSFVGTSQYVSPELLQFYECQHPADLWALGCILYYLYYGQTPFCNNSQLQLYRHIKQAEILLPENNQLNDEAKDLIKRLLVKCPSQRLGSCSRQQLSFGALKKHPYISKFDFDNIFETQPPKLLDQAKNIEVQLEKLFLQKTVASQQALYEKMLIKHTQEKGDIVCKWTITKNFTLQEIQIGDIQNKKEYKLQPDSDNKIAHQLSEKRFSVGVQGSERLILTSKNAKSICQYFNTLSFQKPKRPTCLCLC